MGTSSFLQTSPTEDNFQAWFLNMDKTAQADPSSEVSTWNLHTAKFYTQIASCHYSHSLQMTGVLLQHIQYFELTLFSFPVRLV